MASKLGAALFILAGGVLLGLMFNRVRAMPEHPDAISMAGQSLTGMDRAKVLYQHNCSVCHGEQGDGKGPAATVLDPRPRNFHLGKYRIVSSSNMIAYREDLMRSIRNGLAGTSMPSWKHLGEDDIGLLTDYVISLWKDDAVKTYLETPAIARLKEAQRAPLIKAKFEPKGKVAFPPEPKVDLAVGKKLYLQNCALCHGDDGKGKNDPTWRTAEEFPIMSRNFTSGIFKGGGRPEDLYTRIYAGIPGSPMPSFASQPAADIWQIVYYVQTLAKSDAVAPVMPEKPAETPAAHTQVSEK